MTTPAVDVMISEATGALNGLLSKWGVTVNPDQVQAIATFVVDGLNGAAQRHAQAAGAAAAAKVTTGEEADDVQRRK